MLRKALSDAMQDALRAKEKERLSTLRLISAAIKDKDIEARGKGNDAGINDDEILTVLQKMVRMREEAIEGAKLADRADLIAKEQAEIAIIQSYLPAQLSVAETAAAIREALQETAAQSIRDMGAVMAFLRDRYAGRLDFGAVSKEIKAALQTDTSSSVKTVTEVNDMMKCLRKMLYNSQLCGALVLVRKPC